MASTEVGDPELVASPTQFGGKNTVAAEMERASHELEKQRNPGDGQKIDQELAQYTAESRIELSPERDRELRVKIDKRVLSVMICTYFLQAIDKGTLSFAAIMGLLPDTGLARPDGSPTAQVSPTVPPTSKRQAQKSPGSRMITWLVGGFLVCLVDDLHLHCHPRRRVPPELHYCPSPHCQISQLQHHRMGHHPRLPRRLHQLSGPGHCPHLARHL